MDVVKTLDVAKLSGVIVRVCFAISMWKKCVFTVQEHEKLCRSCNLKGETLSEVLTFIMKIIFEAVHKKFTPLDLENQLLSIGLPSAQSGTFRQVWEQYSEDVCQTLSSVSSADWHLEGISSELRLLLASNGTALQKHPAALIQLIICKPPCPPSTIENINDDLPHGSSKVEIGASNTNMDECNGPKKMETEKNVLLEMNYNAMCKFYDQLEMIQSQMDSLK